MLSAKVRNLGNWNVINFIFISWLGHYPTRIIFSFAEREAIHDETHIKDCYTFPWLFQFYGDELWLQGERDLVNRSWTYGRPITKHGKSALNKLVWDNKLLNPVFSTFDRGSDENYGMITDNKKTLVTSLSSSEEELHNTIKKMTNQRNDHLTSDEKYVQAIIRPNIMTSELYAQTFMSNNTVTFRFNRIDPSKEIKLSDVREWVKHYKDRFEDCTISEEKGICNEDDVVSLRFVVMDKNRKIILVWLVASSTYSIHYKHPHDVKDLLKYLETLHVPKKRTIKRCYNGGKELSVNTVTIDGRFQVHDEFYPMVQEYGGMNALLDQFESSTSNLLILAGQWGGGKSALFQAMCWRDQSEKSEYILVDDPTVYEQPAMFSALIKMIENNTREGMVTHLFLEEADSFIRDKRNNPFLSRLASLSAGAAPLLIKIVIATNDDSEAQIDAALTRGGRLFAMLKFGTLTPEQANKARAVLELEPRDFTENMTLAEALSQSAIITGVATTKKSRGTIGF